MLNVLLQPFANTPVVAEVYGSGNASLTTFAHTAASPYVLPGSVTITAPGPINGKDNGAGLITGTGVTSGTVNYITGAMSITFTSAPASASNNITVTYSSTVNDGVERPIPVGVFPSIAAICDRSGLPNPMLVLISGDSQTWTVLFSGTVPAWGYSILTTPIENRMLLAYVTGPARIEARNVFNM